MYASVAGIVLAIPLGGCDFTEITVTSSTTLDGREVVTAMIQSAVLTPVKAYVTGQLDNFESYVNDQVDGFFDKLEEDR